MIEKFQQQKTSGGPAAGGTTTSGGPTLEGKFEFIHKNAVSNIPFSSAGRAQPDNREGDENCLAVLNNFYDDGVRWVK